MTEGHPLRSILVAIPTLGKRDVHALLEKLNSLPARKQFEVLVVNNWWGARDTQHDDSAGLRVVAEPRQGFASARNAALAYARRERFDLLVFIDDDEYPSRRWLEKHLTALNRWTAAVSFGPVLPDIGPDAPGWLGDGSILRPRRKLKAGPTNADVYSGNTAIDLRSPALEGMWFQSAFDSIGGEDTEFFRRLRARGGICVWAPLATVWEKPDPERLTRRYVLQRAFKAAHQDFVSAPFRATPPAILRKVLQSIFGVGVVLYGTVTLSDATVMRGLRHTSLAAGSLTGIVRRLIVIDDVPNDS